MNSQDLNMADMNTAGDDNQHLLDNHLFGLLVDNQHLFDLLADNELNEHQRRELLARCEAQPEAWRDCALAFIEAQEWSSTLGRSPAAKSAATAPAVIGGQPSEANTEELLPAAAARPVMVSRQPAFWNHSATAGLAMAASLLLAFGLGAWMNPAPMRRLLSPDRPDFAIGSGGESEAGAIGRGRLPQSPRNVRLMVGGATGNDEVQVPIVEGDGRDDDWWRRQPAAMPTEVRRALERQGHQVRERRRLVPFDLEDGRRVMVPVDQVDVAPADQRLYQ
jgi:hypothetical protein